MKYAVRSISIYWWICLALFLCHQVLEKAFAFRIEFFDNYLDPFLSMPIILGIHLYERRFFFKEGIKFKLPFFEIFTITIILSLVFEFIWPKYFAGFYFDPFDFVAYALGALLFELTINK